MDAWRGPFGEEHDFGTDVDLEVKTTLSERREHWISTTTQLMPTGDRSLYLVSIQLTAAALDVGWTLPALVEFARGRLGSEATRLDNVLKGLGYRDRDADLYRSRWALRTMPAFYEIDATFPAVTQERLDSCIPTAERIKELRYRVDLTNMVSATPILPFDCLAVNASVP
jgi:hypothetical protein